MTKENKKNGFLNYKGMRIQERLKKAFSIIIVIPTDKINRSRQMEFINNG